MIGRRIRIRFVTRDRLRTAAEKHGVDAATIVRRSEVWGLNGGAKGLEICEPCSRENSTMIEVAGLGRTAPGGSWDALINAYLDEKDVGSGRPVPVIDPEDLEQLALVPSRPPPEYWL